MRIYVVALILRLLSIVVLFIYVPAGNMSTDYLGLCVPICAYDVDSRYITLQNYCIARNTSAQYIAVSNVRSIYTLHKISPMTCNVLFSTVTKLQVCMELWN